LAVFFLGASAQTPLEIPVLMSLCVIKPWIRWALMCLLRSPRRCVWFHRLCLLEVVASLWLFMTTGWVLAADSFFTGKPLFAKAGMLRLLLEVSAICCFALARLPGLAVMERRGMRTARSYESGTFSARGLSMKFLLQALRRMLCMSATSLVLYAVGLANALFQAPCLAVEPGEASVCHAYTTSCCLFAAANLGFFLFCAAMLSVDPGVRVATAAGGCQGLTQEQIDKLPAHDFGDPAAPRARPQCTICLEDFRPKERVRHLPCGHHFHVQCADTWLLRRAECPMRCHCDLLLLTAGDMVGTPPAPEGKASGGGASEQADGPQDGRSADDAGVGVNHAELQARSHWAQRLEPCQQSDGGGAWVPDSLEIV